MNELIRLASEATREHWAIPVLFEDEHLLALDKPSGLLTSPDRYDPARPNLMKLLHAGLGRQDRWARSRGLTYLANAHRLDFETSGVILLAKDKPALVVLANQFGAEKPGKEYLALVHRAPAAEAGSVQARLGPHPGRAGQMRVDEKHGKRARTDYVLLERFAGYSLLRCQPWTGRTHQVRIHLRSIGLPIVGDRLYGGRALLLSKLKPGYRHKADQEERPLMGRVALHAERLSVAHPVTGASLVISAPWPKDLTVAVKYLRRFARAGGFSAAGAP